MAESLQQPSSHFKDVDDLIDFEIIQERTHALIEQYGDPNSSKCRAALLDHLKNTVEEGRELAEQHLLLDGSGLKCAARLSNLQDHLIGLLYDIATRYIYRVDNPSSAERMAIIAVGGYGRGTLAPGSDIDLLFLLPYKQTPWGESIVEYILYFLWDMKFKVGHATRDVDECVRLSKQDFTIKTSILEARFLWGDRSLFDELEERFDNEAVRGTGAQFIEAKMDERDQRHRKAGDTRYLVEPNIKEGKGGLRDLHTLFWISKYVYRIKSADGLRKAGIFTKQEYQTFKRSGDFLWAVRCHMHYLTGRAEERLNFDLQREMAVRLNYSSKGGMLDVERFMKHYFLVTKNVGNLTSILATKLEEEQVKPTPALGRLMAAVTRRSRAIKGNKDFVLKNSRIVHNDDAVFRRDPVNLLRVFLIADQMGHPFHPNLLHLISRSLKLIDATLRHNEEANRIFLKILSSRRDCETILRKMNEAGVLGRFIPDFGKIVAMMQFNMYHHYTVDEHTIRAIGMLALIERGDLCEEHPVATEIINTIDDRLILYVALFIHDIAKGRPEDHSIAGARIAKKLGKRLGLSAAQTDTISWLVLEHLTMSVIAQSRDLSDPKTIRDFANIVQTPERLKLLLILTICDIRAVGPGVWNGWKGQLLRTLYYETQPLLTGGYNVMALEERANIAKATLSAKLTHWQEDLRNIYVERHYPPYLLRTDLDTQIRHADFISQNDQSDEPIAIDVRTSAFEGVMEMTIYGPDQPNMLSILAGGCARAGANIVGAQIFTTRDGFALDVINIKREFDEEEDEMRRSQRISEEIRLSAQRGGQDNLEKAPYQAGRKSARAFSVETTIIIDNSLSNYFTVIEASGKDRPGLLRDLAQALFELNVNISTAHIATFGERAVDVFYVTDLIGEKITNKARQTSLKKRLAKAFPSPNTPARKAA